MQNVQVMSGNKKSRLDFTRRVCDKRVDGDDLKQLVDPILDFVPGIP